MKTMLSLIVLVLLLSTAVTSVPTPEDLLHERNHEEGLSQPRQPTSQGSTEECIPGASEDNLSIPHSSANLSHITNFGLDLFRELYPFNTTQKNFFFSPYSVWSSLSLAYFASMGKTEEELAHALGLVDKVTALKSWRALEFL